MYVDREDHVLGMQMLREIETMGRNQQKRQRRSDHWDERKARNMICWKLNEEGVRERNDQLYNAVWILELFGELEQFIGVGAWKSDYRSSRRMGGEELETVG